MDGWRDEEPPGEVTQFEPTVSCSVTSSATSSSFHLSASSSLRHLHLYAQESLKKQTDTAAATYFDLMFAEETSFCCLPLYCTLLFS
ncbi:hypothetical protein EYF80_043204 [Liparis tanakae]|uniref:Uncharacterized protein n=1 Tax=Liparis tanakae TaxID=230148 RepID=A0A4Z2FZG2_9TELE|nr:hypothetical protein EYF80_043204 [Liparis tanakae]